MKRLLVLLLGISFAPPLFAKELDLSVPHVPAETKKVAHDKGPCKGCGVVTNVRQLSPEEDRSSTRPDSGYIGDFSDAPRDPDGAIDTTGAKTINKRWAGGSWQTTVRYDDGSYAAKLSSTQPPFHKGDRVQLVSGKLVPR